MWLLHRLSRTHPWRTTPSLRRTVFLFRTSSASRRDLWAQCYPDSHCSRGFSGSSDPLCGSQDQSLRHPFCPVWEFPVVYHLSTNKSLHVQNLFPSTLGPAYNKFGYNKHSAITSRFLCIKIIYRTCWGWVYGKGYVTPIVYLHWELSWLVTLHKTMEITIRCYITIILVELDFRVMVM